MTNTPAPHEFGRAGSPCGFSFRCAVCSVVMVLAAFVLASCAGMDQPASEPEVSATSKPPLADTTNVIHVLPISGIEGPLRLVLADAVAASLRDSERSAVLAKSANDQGPTVMGEVTNVRSHGSVVWVSTKWDLRAPYGTIVADRTREIVIDKALWDRSSVEIVNLIIGDAMPTIAAMVQDHVGPLHVAQGVEIEGEEPQPVAKAPTLNTETVPEAPAQEQVEQPSGDDNAADPPRSLEEEIAELLKPDESGTTPESEMPEASPETKGNEPSTPAASPPLVLAPNSTQPNAFPPEEMGGLKADEMAATPSMANGGADVPAPHGPRKPEETGPMDAPPQAAVQPATTRGVAAAPGDTPVHWGRPSFLVRPVEGAPGDGNEALNSALRAALRGKDLTVTDDPRQAGYEVVGRVEIGPPVNGRQRARISWVVNTIAGEEVGKAVQENVIAAGSLDRQWGRVAGVVTAAAADGIQQLFEAPRPRYTPVGAVPDFPSIPPLPRVPGRALPPPPS